MKGTSCCFSILIPFLIFCSGTANSQSYYDFDLSPHQIRKTAKHAARIGDYYTAIAYYEKFMDRKNTHRKISLELAHLYRKIRDYSKALQQYNRAYEIDPKRNVVALYYKARMLMAMESYGNAIELFSKFRKEYRGERDYNEFSRLARSGIEGCEFAISDTIKNENLYIEHLKPGLNKAYNEFSPYPINQDELIYASIKSDTVIHYADSTFRNIASHRSSFFMSKRTDEKWSDGKPLKGPFNSDDFHIGNGTLSPDGRKFYFTKCQRNWKYKMICNIYYTSITDSGWSSPVALDEPINLKNFTSTQPTFGIDPKKGYDILYFVSDRKGGRGGLDIWYSRFKKGSFTEPRNCGGRLNSDGDEVTPFYDRETNTMYFSSDGHAGYGELDVFKSFGNRSKWMKNPENVGKPINSSADDLYYVQCEDPKEGFFTSNRPGGIALKHPTCCDDIYAYEYDEIRRYVYSATIMSEQTDPETFIREGSVEVYLLDPESLDTTLIKVVDIPENGQIEVAVQRDLDYVMIYKVPEFFSRKVRIPPDGDKRDYTENDTVYLKKITRESIVLKNIYYEFDESGLTEKAKLALDGFLLELLLLNPGIKVEISSHTDSKGSGTYNIRLSQRRAESVVGYLKEKGVPSSQMVARGYGQTRPIAPNTHPDGTDNPEGRQLNRRTEFKVISGDKVYKRNRK